MSLTETARNASTWIAIAVAIVTSTWAVSQTVTEAKLRAVVLEVVQDHDRNPTPHSALTSRYPSAEEHQREMANLSKLAEKFDDFVNVKFREYVENERIKDEAQAAALARIEGRQKARQFLEKLGDARPTAGPNVPVALRGEDVH